MSKISKSQIIQELRSLGIEKGDTIFVAADLMRVGYFNKNANQTLIDWVDIFDEVLGEKGTIVVPTYSPVFLRFFEKYDFVFTKESPSTSGSLAKAYLNFAPGTLRGSHPTNSCASKGKYAKEISESDNISLPKYTPYSKVKDLGGKNLMLGIVDERNCPFTFHLVQQELGHTSKHPYSGLLETSYFDKDGKKQKYIMRELGGCTGGVHKAWGYLLAKNAVEFRMVGRSLSALVDAKKSYEILYKVMIENPTLIKCDDMTCVSCYGRFRYNRFNVIPFYIRNSNKLFRKILKFFFNFKKHS